MNDLNIENSDILLLAIGNTGRGDDGIGWCFADTMADQKLKGLNIEYRYQLQVEDALLVADFPIVIFVDASENKLENGYLLKPCYPDTQYFFSSHIQSPETILYLTETLYNKSPKAFTLEIEGYHWDLEIGLSDLAKKNLEDALHFLTHYLENLLSEKA
jgi:hydrogenase maturation protease